MPSRLEPDGAFRGLRSQLCLPADLQTGQRYDDTAPVRSGSGIVDGRLDVLIGAEGRHAVGARRNDGVPALAVVDGVLETNGERGAVRRRAADVDLKGPSTNNNIRSSVKRRS